MTKNKLQSVEYFQILRTVVKEMKQAEAMVYPCFVTYKNQRYIMIIIRFDKDEKHGQYEIAHLMFIKDGTMTPQLLVTVDNYRLHGSTKDIREFFGIKFDKNNLGTLFETLYQSLSHQLPQGYNVNAFQIPLIKKTSLTILNQRSPNNEKDKWYGHHIMRLPVDGHGNQRYRSDYNSQKTKLLYPTIYDTLFKKDKTISLCYYDNQNMKRSENEILNNFAVNKGVVRHP